MMKSMLTAAAVAVALSGAAMAAEKSDMDGLKTANGKIVADYFKMHFTECNQAAAEKKWYHAKAIEHGWLGNGGGVPGGMGAGGAPGAGAPPAGGAPGAAPPAGAAPQGADGMGAPPAGDGMGAPMGMNAGGKCEPIADMLKIMVQGDLVFVQAHGHTSKPNGDLLWILYRIKDGKIYEHWDTHDAIPDSQAGKQW